MDKHALPLTPELFAYIHEVSLREPELLARLREETARDRLAIMQIPPEQGQFMALLVKLIGARRALEVGTYTGYSALSVAMALPQDGTLISCDVSEEWTGIARRYWAEAGVADKIELRLAPALETLDTLIDDGHRGTFDFAFIDADKKNYDNYYERVLTLLRPGGLLLLDNMLFFGAVRDPDNPPPEIRDHIPASALRALDSLNRKLKDDARVDISLLPVADGITLVRKR